MPKVNLFGLTGGIGSGKSTVANEFKKLGIKIVDADAVAREVVAVGEPALDKIRNHFGDAILLADGSLNRAKLRALIFSDPAHKQWLETLMHPIIRVRIQQQLLQSASLYTLLESPLLLETDQHQLVSKIIVVDTDEETQTNRAGVRDGATSEAIRRIISTQLARAERRARADFIIDNSDSMAATIAQVQSVHQRLTELARTK